MIPASTNRSGHLDPRARRRRQVVHNLLNRLRRAEADLREAKEAANRARTDILANVSHEICTPMNAILGMTEAALDTRLDDQQRDCLEIIKTSGESLLSVINNLLDLGKSPENASGGEPFTIPRLNILLVDDNAFNQKVGTHKLKKMGHEVWVASSGAEALGMLAVAQFELIFMDIHMKDMDGLEATRLVRQHEQSTARRTPILAMTASALKEDRMRCLDAGMDGFVSKPIRDEDLSRAIRSVIRHTPTTSHEAEPVPQATTEAPAASSFNLAKSRERVGGNLKLLDELIGTFREDCPTLMSEIGAAVRQGNPAELCQAAHTLKSMLLFFEATTASQCASRLETMGRYADLDGAPDVFSQLSAAVAQVLNVFSEQGASLS